MGKKTKKGKTRLDKFYHLAKDQGYRARSAFKLIQLAKKSDFLSKARVCIDLCAAPGGWSQVAQKNMPMGSLIIAIDLVPIKSIHGVTCIQSDITTDKCRSLLKKELKGSLADVVLHDGAPNVGTTWAKDAYSQAELTLRALKLACEHLRFGGTFVTKVFRSSDYNSLLWVFNQLFTKVEATKPTASRNVSAEIFCLCNGFKAGKIDPRFFEPKWVFMELLDAKNEAGVVDKKPPASLRDLIKYQGKRHRSGYELGDDHRVITAQNFIATENPAEILVSHHQINLDAPDSQDAKQHALTTAEIQEFCADLKVLGKRDLSTLLKWRIKIVHQREKAERAARKAGQAGSLPGGQGSEAAAAVSHVDAAATAVAKDVDDAIADLLEDRPDTSNANAALGSSSEAEVADEELEKDLAEQIDKRRREERRDAKKTMTRQKKSEMRRKMSLGSTKAVQDHPDLFRSTKHSVKALEDQDKYIDPRSLDSGGEESSDCAPVESRSESDGELDKLARLEVDVAVDKELHKIWAMDKHRKKMQRQLRGKKETRRQRVLAAWAGELDEFNEVLDRQNEAEHSLRDKEEVADDDDSELDLQELREFQEHQRRALGEEEGGEQTADGEALTALVDGPPRPLALDTVGHAPERTSHDSEDETAQPLDASGGALVPVDTASEEALRAEHRAARWFSQDIFQSARPGGDRLSAMDDDSSGSEGSGAEVVEIDEDRLPKLPLTDKQKRKLKRRREKEKLEKLGKKPKTDDDNAPLEVAPLEPPRSIVQTERQRKFEKPSDPQELAETLALGSLLVESKKSRMELIDAAYNRWTFEGDEDLPDWFKEEEDKHNKPQLPISKELMRQFRAKLREINARPIRKVAQAKARKKRRLQKRLDKLRSTATSLADMSDMSESAKARQIRRELSKAAREDKRKVTVVAVKKGGGALRGRKEKGKVPKGAKVKVVDRRMKADTRGEKKANTRNPQRQKKIARKVQRMKTKGRGKKKLRGGADKKSKVDGKGIHGGGA